MRALGKLLATPMWFVMPSLLVAIAIGMTVSGYTPLVFDPSLYQAQSALASELTSIDAEAIEKAGASSASVGGDAVAADALQDGTWTGYAACGQGNADDWKPYYVAVTIEVKNQKVTGIASIAGSSSAGEGSTPLNWDAAENQRYLDQAIASVKPQMESQIAAAGDVSAIDTVSGATYSAVAIYNAYRDAVARAGGQAGNVGAAALQAPAANTAGTGQKVEAPAAASAAELADGDWTGYAACGQGNSDNWKPYYVGVTVRVKGGKATKITKVFGSSTGNAGDAKLTWDASENQKYLGWAESGHNGDAGVKDQINSKLGSGTVSDVDTVSKATFSSVAIFNAYADALSKAAKAAGNTTAKAPAKKASTTGKKPRGPEKTTAHDTNVGALADGSWTGYAKCGPDPDQDWKPYYVAVTITIKDGKFVSLDHIAGSSAGDAGQAKLNYDAAENEQYLEGAIWGVGGALEQAAAKSTIPSSIDTVSGATYSSDAIFEAFYAALKKAAAAGGTTIEEPSSSTDGKGDSGSGSEDSESGSGENGSSEPASGGGDSGSNSGDEGDGSESGSGDSGSGDSGSDPGSGAGGGDGDSGDGDNGEEPGDGGNGEESGDNRGTSSYYGYAYCSMSGSDSWDPYYLFVQVEATDGVVTRIADVFPDSEGLVDPAVRYSASQNATYLNWAIDGKFGGTGYRMKSIVKQIQAKLDAAAAVSGIQTVSGATRSSKSILSAYEMAVANAQAGVGKTPESAVALAQQ